MKLLLGLRLPWVSRRAYEREVAALEEEARRTERRSELQAGIAQNATDRVVRQNAEIAALTERLRVATEAAEGAEEARDAARKSAAQWKAQDVRASIMLADAMRERDAARDSKYLTDTLVCDFMRSLIAQAQGMLDCLTTQADAAVNAESGESDLSKFERAIDAAVDAESAECNGARNVTDPVTVTANATGEAG